MESGTRRPFILDLLGHTARDPSAFSLIVANLQALTRNVKPAVFYRIVNLALRQYEGVFDGARRQISIVGPVNVGKSSLFNALLMPRQSAAEVSPIPGTTRLAQAGDAGMCTVIDTPGGEEAAGEERKELRGFRAIPVFAHHDTVGEPLPEYD